MRAPFHSEPLVELYQGDVLDVLGEMPEASVQAVISSPPYIGLRDYGIPPRVWGGDPACDHEWGPPGDPIKPWQGTDPKRNDTANRDAKTAPTGSFCACGSWLGCHGLEPSPDIWVRNELEIFRALRRLLRDDGMIMWNIGDTYGGSGGPHKADHLNPGMSQSSKRAGMDVPRLEGTEGLQLMGMPYRLMLALQADGWIVRSLNIWAKGSSFDDRSGAVMPSPVQGWRWEQCRIKVKAGPVSRKGDPGVTGETMPGWDRRQFATWIDCQGCEKCSPKDGLVLRRGSWRPTAAFEVILQIVKSGGYFSDGHSVREEGCPSTLKFNPRYKKLDETGPYRAPNARGGDDLGYVNQGAGEVRYISGFRNLRNFWRINTAPYKPGHFAVYPSKLVEPLVKMSTPEAGSCSACGAPWARVIAKAYTPGGRGVKHGKIGDGARDPETRTDLPEERMTLHVSTLGHRATCSCDVDARPAVILDPFSGSGTTAAVARRLGRKAIGIEINEEYLGLAVERLLETDAAESPKTVRVAKDQMGTQEGLFS